MVPEANVLDRCVIPLERRPVKRLRRRELTRLDPVESVGLPRHPDGVGDERALRRQLVR